MPNRESAKSNTKDKAQRVDPAWNKDTTTTRTEQTSGVEQAAEGLSGNDFSEATFTRHAEMLGSPSLSNPANWRVKRELILGIQRDYGNQYVQRLVSHLESSEQTDNKIGSPSKDFYKQIAQRVVDGTLRNSPEAKSQASFPIQTKLSVGPAGDKYEREADQVAKRVVGNLNPTNGSISGERQQQSDIGRISRVSPSSGQSSNSPQGINGNSEAFQTLPSDEHIGLEGGELSSDLEGSVNQSASGGKPLPDNLRSSMEGAFGADFSDVHVHTGSEADSLNRSMSAKAFTTGTDIFFANGEYDPESKTGQQTLAHELTHVVQQNGASSANGPAQRTPVIQRETEDSDDDNDDLYASSLEQDDEQALGNLEDIDSSGPSEMEIPDLGQEDPGEQEEPSSDRGSAFIDGKVKEDTDVFDYSKQGDQYTVNQNAVGAMQKGDSVKVAAIVDSTGTYRMVERDVGVGFALDKDLRFDVSYFKEAFSASGDLSNEPWMAGIAIGETQDALDGGAEAASDSLSTAWGGLKKAYNTAEGLDKAAEDLSESAKTLSFFGKIIEGAEFVGKVLEGLYNGYIGGWLIGQTFLAPLLEIPKVRDRSNAAKALAKARDSAGDNEKVRNAADYGYRKATRGFRVHMWRMISGFARMIMKVITLLSGGTTGIVTVPADAVLSVAKAAEAVFHKLKGFWKFLTGRRGKGRATNAGTLVDEAVKGDRAALQLLIELRPSFAASVKDKAKEKLKKLGTSLGIIENYYPASTDEMHAVITSLGKKEIEKMKKELAKRLKSV